MTSPKNGSSASAPGTEPVSTPASKAGDVPRIAAAAASVSTRTSRQRWMLGLKWLIAMVVIVGLGVTIQSAVQQWRDQPPQSRVSLLALDPGAIAVAAVLYGLGIAVSFMVVRQAMLALGHRTAWHVVLAAQVLGHVGKYVPGKAMVVVLRVGALATHGVAAVPATISVFVETLTMLAVGSAIACSLVFTLPLPAWIRAGAVLMAITAIIPTLPPILSRIAGRLTHSTVDLRGPSGLWLLLVSLFWSFVSWVLIGGSLAAVLWAIPHPDSASHPWPATWELVWLSVAAIGLAFSVGFVSLLPGGAGVRELVLVSMLSPAVGTPHALVATLLLRLLFIVVESILALAAYGWLRKISPDKIIDQKVA